MVYGLPSWGDTPVDPHSAFTHLKNYPIDGGLVDGPVYGNIYNNLIGITLYQPDEYEEFQSNLAVYHDDHGAIIRGDSSFPSPIGGRQRGAIALVFTGDEFADGGDLIASVLKQQNIRGSFFFTGRFYNNPAFKKILQRLN